MAQIFLFFISLSIITGMLLGPIALFRLKIFMTSSISSAVVGYKKNVFVFFFFGQERAEGLLSLRNTFKQFSSYCCKEAVKVICNDKVV